MSFVSFFVSTGLHTVHTSLSQPKPAKEIFEENEIELHMLQRKIHTSFREASLKLIKSHTLSYLSALGEFQYLRLFLVTLMVCMSHAFVYDAVDLNKIIVISSY